MKLRPYQEKLINEAREKLRAIKAMLKAQGIERGPRLLIQCPTGGGKTVLASFIIQSHIQNVKGAVARFMAHRDFLIDQTSQTFEKCGIDHSFIAAGRWMNNFTPVHVCMIPTVTNRVGRYVKPTLVIWDECHHIAARSWNKIMETWDSATHIGFSATPVRLDGKGLDAFYDDIVIGPTVAELIELGALSDYTYFAPSSPDLSGLHVRMGDYVQSEIDEEMGKSVIIGNLVEHYGKLARGKKAVYFCTSIKNSMETAQAFNAQGFRFIHLDGSHSAWERQQAAQALARGDLDGMTNVALFGEGFDLAAQAKMDVTIEVVGLAKPTKSLGLSRQMVGRVLRAKDYPGIILDHAGHIKEHGLPDDEVSWSLKGVEKKGNTQTYQCEQCGAETPIQTLVCKACGHAHERDTVKRPGAGGSREVEHRDGDLQEIDRDALRKAKKLEEWQCETIGDLIDLAKRRGYQHPEKWAAHIFTAKAQRREAREYAAKQQSSFFEGLMK